jgi:kynureninase
MAARVYGPAVRLSIDILPPVPENNSMTLEEAEALDRGDPLAPLRERFFLPDGVVYLDGNSLGALPKSALARVQKVAAEEWGKDLITSWNRHDWIDLPRRVGDKIAPLIGAPTGSVVVGDSTSINIFKVLGGALGSGQPGLILTEAGDFPTDVYVAQGLGAFGGHEVKTGDLRDLLPAGGSQVPGSFSETAGRPVVVVATEVNYRTGARHDMVDLVRRAHASGVLVVTDLCHSAGAFPVDVAATGTDFAVGCGYKYLNGGPGAPAFAYVAPKRLEGLRQPLSGWMGHARPFDFAPDYRPAEGIDALRVGTPPILSMSALDAALDAFEGVDLTQVRAKADALFDLFAGDLPEGVELLTPTDPSRRGTQVSLRHPEAYAVIQALISRGVIGDFRPPDIMRFGLTPLYLRFADITKASGVLREIIETGAWDRPEFKQRAKVV